MAFVKQNSRDKKTLCSKAPWYAYWIGVDGKEHSQKVGKKSDAKEIAAEHERNAKRQGAGLILDMDWEKFRVEYETLILPKMRSPRSQKSAREALDVFADLVKPGLMAGITMKDMETFVAKRSKQDGKKPGSKVAAATILKDLRTVRAALEYARQWNYLSVVPMMPTVDGYESQKRFVTVEHFEAMLKHTDAAERPNDAGVTPAEWWDAILSLLWFAPNRIEAILSLLWENVDLEAGTVLTLARSNKQKRDHVAYIPGAVAEKLRAIKRFSPLVFAFNAGEMTLYRHFHKIQTAAGIHLPCTGEHVHTDWCHWYGFHDFRRSFATLNQELPASMKQGQMGHSTYATTQRYEKFAQQRENFADKLYAPPSMQKATGN